MTLTADRLGISQSSVSYHIKKLETEFSLALFRRTSSGLELTTEGQLLLEHVKMGFGYIEAGLEKITHKATSVKIALLPMFASRWLSPRLGSHLEANPQLQLSINNHNNTFTSMDNAESFADLGIQWGTGNWKGFHAQQLWPEELVVVCSPGYLRLNPITSPQDITSCTLLHVDDERMWEEWFSRRGMTPNADQQQMMLQDRHFQLSSTINGLGVSLFASWLVQDELRSGKLINPFVEGFETQFAYYLVSPKKAPLSRSAKNFSDWILKTAHAQRLD